MTRLIEKIDQIMESVCAPKWRFLRNIICILLSFMAILSVFLLMYIPICASHDFDLVIIAADALVNMESEDEVEKSFALLQLGALALIVACMVIGLIFVFKQLLRISEDEDEMIAPLKTLIVYSAVITVVYTLFTYLFSPINIMMGGYSESMIDYTPIVMISVTAVLYAVLVGIPAAHRRRKKLENELQIRNGEIEYRKYRRLCFIWQLISLLFVIAVAAVAVLSLMSDIVTVTFEESSLNIPDIVISGADVIIGTQILETTGERTVAYFILVLFYATVSMLMLSIVSFIGRSNHCNKMMTASMIVSSVACVFVGLFGQYYKVVQRLNSDVIDKLLEQYFLSSEDLLKYEAESGSLVYCLVLLGVLALLFICKPLSRAHEAYKKQFKFEVAVIAPSAELNINTVGMSGGQAAGSAARDNSVAAPVADRSNATSDSHGVTRGVPQGAPQSVPVADGRANADKDFDPCPAFTELDYKKAAFDNDLVKRRRYLLESPTLPNLVSYIVRYARDSKHHLFYTEETVAAFLAGLGSTRLTILQGMSGTGKTSLPKIVSEALMSVCDIVEVESSWRDKNELLGYYNEFNRIYTPKKFTQALYKACLNRDTVTFIVLDEMNLSRIEYYFSDFLSLMENDPDKREIKLLNTPLARISGEQKIPYAALSDGHTLKIPPNVWFIGTANRDESTYDISDKVYDRAHTMNFDKRAEKPAFYGEPISARYLPAGELIRLLDEARATSKINIENYPMIRKAEELLAPYNISFGNRIAMQIESFVGIYSACFNSSSQAIHDGVDIIMLSKVVKKLELKSVDDKETLAMEFDKIGLKRCAGFIAGLRED